jgi:hypothetical protein
MTTHDPIALDLQRTVDELRNQVLEAKMSIALVEAYLKKANQDRDDWQDLATRAIAQIEEWRTLCDEWQARYNQLLGAN